MSDNLGYSTQHELGTFVELSCQLGSEEKNSIASEAFHLEELIHSSADAGKLIYLLERQLYEDCTISKRKPSLPSLEKTLFDLACKEVVCEGVFYSLCCRYRGHIVVRYVESGCYQGFMTYAAADILKEELGVERLNLLNVYTAADIRHRKTQDGEDDVNQAYIRNVVKNRSSVQNQVTLLRECFLAGQKEVTLLSLTVHCVRKNPRPSCNIHRYLNLYPENSGNVQTWEKALKNYIAVAPKLDLPEEQDLLEIQPHQLVTLENQFKFISQLSSNPFECYPKYDGTMSSSDFSPSFAQHLLYPQGDSVDTDGSKPTYYPTSLRNRLLYFHMHGYVRYVRCLCKHAVVQMLNQ